MKRDAQRERTYRAEEAWAKRYRRQVPKITSLYEARNILARLVPPVLVARTTVEEVKARSNDHGLVDYDGWGRWTLAVKLPAEYITVTHELAHLVSEALGHDGRHDADFRSTHVWVVRELLGLNPSGWLTRYYQKEGLD